MVAKVWRQGGVNFFRTVQASFGPLKRPRTPPATSPAAKRRRWTALSRHAGSHIVAAPALAAFATLVFATTALAQQASRTPISDDIVELGVLTDMSGVYSDGSGNRSNMMPPP
jgi:hypothetical protein